MKSRDQVIRDLCRVRTLNERDAGTILDAVRVLQGYTYSPEKQDDIIDELKAELVRKEKLLDEATYRLGCRARRQQDIVEECRELKVKYEKALAARRAQNQRIADTTEELWRWKARAEDCMGALAKVADIIHNRDTFELEVVEEDQ